MFFNLNHIEAEFKWNNTWIHFVFRTFCSSVASPLAQNKNQVGTLCTELEIQFHSLSLLLYTLLDQYDGYSKVSFMGRERTGFPKTVILHLSIRVGDSTILLPRVLETWIGSFCNCFIICVIYEIILTFSYLAHMIT